MSIKLAKALIRLAGKTKKRPHLWQNIVPVKVYDPDGWRRDGLDWNTPITLLDFVERASQSTLCELSVDEEGNDILSLMLEARQRMF